MLTFVTLGPEGSNHHFVLQRYLVAHDLVDAARIELIDDFHRGAKSLQDGRADFMLQCAVHPATPEITAAYRKEVFVVDAFISPSRPMALVRARARRQGPGRVAVQPATRHYADLSGWTQIVHEPTVSAVGEGLLEGRYEAGIAFASLVEEHPREFEIQEFIGAVCDAWVVFGTRAVDGGRAVVWKDSPVSACYRDAAVRPSRR
jgi:hypothetical protein